MIKILVNNKEIEVEEGSVLLQACLDNNIYIPNLCYLKDMDAPPSSCRMCFVEIEGEKKPVTSCTVKVREGMIVNTESPAVKRLQTTALQLLLSVHNVECGKCPANKKCELQRIAKFLKVGLKPGHLDLFQKEPAIDRESPVFDYYPNRCVLCGRCIYICKKQQRRPFLTFAKRGIDTIITFSGEDDLTDLPCKQCLACIEICPVAAIILKSGLTPPHLQAK